MSSNKSTHNANNMANVMVHHGKGIIDYDPESIKEVVGGEKLTYDEYIRVQEESAAKVRGSFQLCYYECALGFKGQIERCTRDKVCFKRIFVEGMYMVGAECFDGKEDHVWMDLKGFEEYQEGDSLSFFAEVYRYLKTGNGKEINFGLRNPTNIKKIADYELPSDEELQKQALELLICDNCYLKGSCSNGTACLFPKKRNSLVNNLYKHAL